MAMISKMGENSDSKRKSRNLSEKKRRDQFNNLISELNQLIDQGANSGSNETTIIHDDDDDEFGPSPNCVSGQVQRKVDKSSVLKNVIKFLAKHKHSEQQQETATSSKSATKSVINEGSQDEDPLYRSDPDVLPNSHEILTWKPSYITDDEFSVQMLEALDAFIVVCEVDQEARIIYSSDTLNNLLNYTGTCNSLRQNDYVSLYDLVAADDKQQIEKLLSQESRSSERVEYQNQEHQQDSHHSVAGTSQKSNHYTRQPIDKPNVEENYVSLVVNFLTCLNLSEIKQRRQQDKSGGQFDTSGGRKVESDLNLMQEVTSRDHQFDAFSSDYRNLVNVAMQQDQQEQRGQQNQQQEQQPHSQHHLAQHQQQQQLQQHQCYKQMQPQPLRQQGSGQEMVYMQVVDDDNRSNNCSRSQHSIAEKQQLLMSEGRREQQEHNQHEQQKRQLQSRQDEAVMQNVDDKQLNDDNQSSESNTSNNIPGDNGQQTSTDANSDDNNQISGAGSDDALDGNQAQGEVIRERRQLYKHHHRHQHQLSRHNQREKNNANGQQFELARLTGTFKSFVEDHLLDPPASKLYFICIGKLNTPRSSYDLQIIVPPVIGGINLFHNNQFLSKHTLKWRFLWIDSRAPSIIGYSPFEMLGTSGYDYYHWDDLDKLVISHESLIRDGHASSGPYRFLTKGQQWIWLQTTYSIVHKSQSDKNSTKRLKKQRQSGTSSTSVQNFKENNDTLKKLRFIICTHTVIGFDEKLRRDESCY